MLFAHYIAKAYATLVFWLEIKSNLDFDRNTKAAREFLLMLEQGLL